MATGGLICNCGLIKQGKVGATTRDGVEICNACGLPLVLTPEVLAAAAAATQSVVVPPDRVTTLADLPGFRVTKVLGVVTELSATSGLTATIKGTSALDAGMTGLRRTAGAMNANAILGLASSSFGAGGGITSAFGGDAVGVLLIGTAAIVEPTGESAES